MRNCICALNPIQSIVFYAYRFKNSLFYFFCSYIAIFYIVSTNGNIFNSGKINITIVYCFNKFCI